MNDLIQGSQKWLSARKGKITASKLPILLGLSPYQTPLQLWNEELGFIPPQETKPHMQAGLDVEKEARDYFEQQFGIEVIPDVVFHPNNPKFMASLDGISYDRKTIVEIKKNNASYHQMAKEGKVIPFHIAQMQWQMYCTGIDCQMCHYISYREGDECIVVVARDDEFIEKAVVAANEFLRLIQDLEEPPLMDADYEDVSNNESIQYLIDRYHEAYDTAKKYEQLAESYKKDIIQQSNDRNVRGNGWKLTRSSRKGNVDYDAIMKQFEIDVNLDGYRKPPTTSYRISFK